MTEQEDAPEGAPSPTVAGNHTTGYDIEVLLHVLAVRQLLDSYTTGMLLPTSVTLDKLGNVLTSPARYQWAADSARRAA